MIASVKTRPSFKQGFARSARQSTAPNLQRGLTGAWIPPLGPTGNALFDVSTSRLDGTLTNMDPATDWGIDLLGYMLSLDGSDDYISIPRPLGASHRCNFTGDFTIVCWFTTASLQDRGIWRQMDNTTTNWTLLYIEDSGDKLAFQADDNANKRTLLGTTALTIGPLYQAAITRDAGGFTLYLNAVVEATAANNGDCDGGFDLFYGRRGTAVAVLDLSGNLGPLMIYNRGLMPSEIKQLFIDPLAAFRLKIPTVGFKPAAVAVGKARLIFLTGEIA